MSYNTNVRIPMSKTASLSDAQNEATETWAEVGNNPINNFSTEGEQKYSWRQCFSSSFKTTLHPMEQKNLIKRHIMNKNGIL